MGIGTSDGKYYPTEMEQALDSFDDRFRDATHELQVWNGPMQTRTPDGVILDPVGDGERYDDTMTNEQKYRNEEVWKQGYEGAAGPIINPTSPHFNDTLNEINKQPAPRSPITPVSDLPTTKPLLPPELQGLPRITVTPNEPEQVTATDKRGFWNQITGADGQPRYRLFPERILDHLVESTQRFGDLLKGDAQLPSKTGVPGSVDANDPEALRNLGAVTDMAGFLIMGPGRDAAIQASPITFSKAQQSLASIERITPESSRGGAEVLGSHAHPDPRTLEEQIAEIMRPRSRAEVAAADPTRQPIRPTNSDIDRAMQEIADSLRMNPTATPTETYARYLRESGLNSQYPRGWREVEGGATSPGSTAYANIPGMASKTVQFANKEGKKFYVEATSYGDHLAVGMIGSMTKDGYKMGINTEFANTMGISGMRTVLKKLQEEFPGAKTISGFRVTGARSPQGGGRATMKLPQK